MLNDFFNLVLHDEGYYSVLSLKHGHSPKQYLVPTLAELYTLRDSLRAAKRDVYFACAKYETDKNRTRENAKWLKAFRLDLDCAADGSKPYRTQSEAISALKAFCNKLSLPKPILVNSGNGVHVYWALTRAIGTEEYYPLAQALKNAVSFNGLKADQAVTVDAARVLRFPGTENYKTDPPNKVKIITLAEPIDFGVWKELFANYIPQTITTLSGRAKFDSLDPVTKALMGNKESSFREILRKSLKGEGCRQLVNILTKQATIDYNLWRAGLSIAVNCEDAPKAIHKISERHPNYSPEETETKANDAIGKPYRCETFADINPEGCSGCTFRNKITSPIQLHHHVIESTDNVVEVPDTTTGEIIEVEVPKYPYPYIRGKNGGVYRRGAPLPDGGREDDELVYPYDFYVVSRLEDPDQGETVKMRLHTPNDGIKEFFCPYTNLVAKDKLSTLLAKQGMPLTDKRLHNIMAYITRCIEELQRIDKAEIARNQFGWCESDTKFVVGNREISAQGIKYSPSSAATAEVATYYDKKGTIEGWREVSDIYNIEGNEVRAFCLFAGFGSPLLKFTDLDGGIIHLTNNGSGVGKTTVQYMVNSIWGHPKRAILGQKDTYLSRMQRTVLLGNLPITIDELTNMSNEEASDMLYNISHGRVRNRLQAQANAERSNSLRWSLIGITSGNKSIYDQLFALKEFPEGELMRLLEFNVSKNDTMSKEESDIIFRPLYENYGVAGDRWMQYVITNLDQTKNLLQAMQKKIDADCGFTQRERYWSAMCSCAMTAGVIANKLGITKINIQRVYKWLVYTMRQMKVDIKPNVTSPSGHLGQFLAEHINNILIINDDVDSRSGLYAAPIREPRGELMVRFEPDTKCMYVIVKSFREWCNKYQISFKGVKETMMLEGALIGETKKSMTKGTPIKTPSVWALRIDCNKLEDSNIMNNLMPEDL